MSDLTSGAMADTARRIFELTALHEDDVEAEAVAIMMARELTGIAKMFEDLIADDKIVEESKAFFGMLIDAARVFAEILPVDPYRMMDFNVGMKPAYLAASELCADVIDIVSEAEFLPEWRTALDEQCRRLKFFMLILRENPDNLIRSV